MKTVQADHITKTFSPGRRDAVTALDNVSLYVEAGEIFGLLGPNGAGKTTFIKVLLSIAFPTSGTATVLGKPLGDTGVKAQVGYLPENHRYPPYLSGEQVLRYFGKLGGITGRDLNRRIGDILRLVEMERWSNVKIRKYSKGMMQRIGLAQALLNTPRLVFLDEPTDGVDPIGRRHIRDVLTRMRDEGTAVFLNSHLLSEVELICDRVAILNKGRLVQMGSVRELTEHQHHYVIGFNGDLPEGLRMQWDATRVPYTLTDSLLTVTMSDLGELNALIDQLRAAGVLIERVDHKRSSLEDQFIQVLSREES